ncbi:MAG: S1 RNA-binding domain-containing protein [Deltaproteobacteria bacterium]|nr:S1 RNA-binding domain-containing protein [Deltaproteobacteria bacterium]
MAAKDDFASFMETSFSSESKRILRRLNKGDVVTGSVVQIGGDWVFVDIGSRADGRIASAQLEDDKGEITVKLGDQIKATVIDPHASGGPMLAVTLGKEEVDIDSLRFAMTSNVPVEGKVTRAVKAGLEVEIGAVRAFCPASQIDLGYSAELGIYVDSTFRFKIVEIRDGGRSVVVSRRAILEQERAEKARDVIEQLQVGHEREGVVQSIQKYGAFVDIGGVQGLLHISELVHGRVERVEDVVKVGETIKVRILEINKTESGAKISLSMKALQQMEEKVPEAIGTDEVLRGKVTRLTSFGLFVVTDKGEGLVPLQELPSAPGSDHRRAYPVGKEVEVVLLEKDPSSGKLRFSVSGVLEAAERKSFREYEVQKNRANESSDGLGSFGELLQKKLGVETRARTAKPARQERAAPTPVPPGPSSAKWSNIRRRKPLDKS